MTQDAENSYHNQYIHKVIHNFTKRAFAMFADLFDFAKKRTLKESIGFFIFHGTLATAVLTVIKFMEAAA